MFTFDLVTTRNTEALAMQTRSIFRNYARAAEARSRISWSETEEDKQKARDEHSDAISALGLTVFLAIEDAARVETEKCNESKAWYEAKKVAAAKTGKPRRKTAHKKVN